MYFKILDFYSVHSEIVHQVFSLRKGIFTSPTIENADDQSPLGYSDTRIYKPDLTIESHSSEDSIITNGSNIPITPASA